MFYEFNDTSEYLRAGRRVQHLARACYSVIIDVEIANLGPVFTLEQYLAHFLA